MEKLCRLFGHSRQAYYQHQKSDHQQSFHEEIILEMIRDKRKLMSRIGARKLLELITPGLHRQGLEMGRDAFFDLLRDHGMLIRKRRRKVITTYSRKILGYYLSEDLKTTGAIKALEMAFANSLYPLEGLIHHSDRGIQYCSGDYVELLKEKHVQISMTNKGDPLENAIAERVNGILKDEWIHQTHYKTKADAKAHIHEIVPIYNNIRPHASCDMLTPEKSYLTSGLLKKRWKTYPRRKLTKVFSEV